MEYYAIIDGKRLGPFTIEELEKKPIDRRTLVWHAGLSDWVPASKVRELDEFLKATPPPMPAPHCPPLPPVNDLESVPDPPKSWLPWAILATIIGAFFYLVGCIPGVVGIYHSVSAQNKYNDGDYRGAKSAENTARAWTITGLCIAGIVVVLMIICSSIINSIFDNIFYHAPYAR